jgi:hypothetical protein
MNATTEQINVIAMLIANQLRNDLDEKFEALKNALLNQKPKEEITTYERRKVAKIFSVTPDTISTWALNGILDPSCFQVINGRYKFFKDKIDELILKAKAGTWQPSARHNTNQHIKNKYHEKSKTK